MVIEDPPATPSETPMSPSLSAVIEEGVGRDGSGMSETAMENITPLPVLVHGQQACQAVHFRVDPSTASNREGGGSLSQVSMAPKQLRGRAGQKPS